MHAYLVTGRTNNDRLEWANKFFNKEKIEEILNIIPEGKNIVIESIRRLTHRLSFAPQNPEVGRGVVVENAQLLTQEAANAFLKTLEEPPGKTIFILTAPNKEVVLETIASRATHISLGPSIFGLSPEETQEAEKLFEKLTKSGVGERLEFLDTIKNRDEATKFCINQLFVAREAMLRNVSKRTSLDEVSSSAYSFYPSFIHTLSSTLRDLESNTNVKLALGNLLLNYQ